MNYFLEYLFCLSEVVVFNLFLGYLVNNKPKYSKLFIGFFILIISLVIFFFTLFQFSIYIKGTLVILVFFIFSGIYNFSTPGKLFLILLFNLIIILVEVSFISFFSFISNIHPTKIIDLDSNLRYLIALISKLVNFLSVYIVAKTMKPNKIFLPKKYSLLILGILLLTISTMIFLFQRSLILGIDTEVSQILFITSIAFTFINIAIFYYYLSSNNFYLESQKFEIERLYRKANEEYVRENEKQSEYLLNIWHDLKNHMKNIELLIENNDFQNSLEYFKSLKKDTDKISNRIITGNKIADIVLNRKNTDAILNDIKFYVNATIPSNLPFKVADFSSVLFNTIDNAIEANLNIKNKEDRLICIKIYPKKQYLCYEIINNINSSQIHQPRSEKYFNQKEYVSTGYGLMILKDIADRYNGYLDYGIKGNQFTLRISLLIL